MYQSSSSSSSSQSSMRPTGLIRYDSAPSSFLSNAVDSVIGHPPGSQPHPKLRVGIGDGNAQTMPPYFLSNSGFNLRTDAAGGPPSLIRHSSSPAGFLNQLAASVSTAPSCSTANNVTRGMNSFNSSNERGGGITRLNSQLSFTRQDALSLISEEEEHRNNNDRKSNYSTSTFGAAAGGSSNWDVDSNTNIAFSSPNKRSKTINASLDSMETQLQFGLTHDDHHQGALEMNSMEMKLLHNIPQDSVPCKLRAKRGFATHPRSIAERERRTRISGKLKKLQELVPNMDKQTSYADMLDLAVQQIKGLQTQVQKLENDMENCTCGCKPTAGTS
ncbi:transcription factor bHLH128-like isoform X2 [Impatiens glandulifera]|uniref:transcription factor bHLH128-like isoform X2 n=1 Tax=Impatiens glandulifera TaxID=253017 RepID=UPI001FB17C01|nr:transcription factor bHLH128-like isoform X2 [Impatiens glandulifera]